MTDTIRRKAAIAAYKERKTAAGIYAVRCAATGQAWVGRTPNLDSVETRLWFTLRQGGHPNRGLQAAWAAHDAPAFTVEVLERLEDEEFAFARDAWLKDRLAHWRSTLDAPAL